jgi:uncharacterized membrane protein
MMHKNILPLLIIALMFAIAFYAEPLVQTNQNGEVITHWNLAGNADGWSSKAVGVYLLPIITLIIYLGLSIIPKIEVYQDNLEEFEQQFWGFKVLLVFVMGVIYVATLLPNLGYWGSFDPSLVIIFAVALLFFYVGYMLNFTKRNYFIGVRTPWTLADERIWEKTNKLAGKLFWICCALALVGLVVQGDLRLWLLIGPAIATAIVACLYSLYEYLKTKKRQKAGKKSRRK